MRITGIIAAACAALACSCAHAPSAPSAPEPQATSVSKETPLILEKNEGERRIWRPWPGHPEPGGAFVLKVDPKNGGSSHLVFGTEDLQPGDGIDPHKHPESDEILFLQTGTARVHLGDSVRDVHAGATVFIPANTWISLKNIRKRCHQPDIRLFRAGLRGLHAGGVRPRGREERPGVKSRRR